MGTEICKLILAKGDLQVSDKERQAQQEAMFKDIATVISNKCVNPETKEKDGDSMTMVLLASPGLYRDIEQVVRDETQGAGNLELLNLIEVRDDEEKLE